MTNIKKSKHFLFIVFLIVLTFIKVNFASAMEIDWTNLGLPANPDLPTYVSFIFSWAIGIAGILALISFAIGAIGLINPNVESHNDAKDRMKGAVLGLVLTVASYIILNTINPVLVTPTLTPLAGLSEVFLYNGSTGEQKPCPGAESNTSTLAGFNQIKYICADSAAATSPKLLVWIFPNAGLEEGNGNLNGVTTREVSCSSSGGTSGTGSSFKIAFETPGVYFCLGSGCSTYRSAANTSSQNNISAPFNGNIRGVKIVNSPTNNYGVIFHKVTGLANGGQCSAPIITGGLSTPTLTNASSADIFVLNGKLGASGDGVAFYSEPYGWDTGANAGFLNIPDSDIIPLPFPASTIDFGYTNVDRPDGYQTECATFQDCPGSIKIKGSYLVGLYSSASYCQTFTQDVPNLNAQPIIASGGGNLGNVYIIPTK